MGGLFVWMKQARVDAPEEVSAQDHGVEDSADPGEEVVDTTETGVMAKGVTATGASEVATGALEAAATGVVVAEVATPQVVDTEKIGVRVHMVTALEPTAMDTMAMLHTSKHLPDSRSSLGWLYFKDALLKKNVHVLLLTLVCSSVVVAKASLKKNVAFP